VPDVRAALVLRLPDRWECDVIDPELRTFGGRLKLMRTSADMKQADLAAKVGISRASIANMERAPKICP
jgi:DNA-binding XRE family transcriptional regulator